MELGVGGQLQVMRDRQTIVAPLKEGKTVIMVANSLLNSKQLDISVTGQQIKLKSRLIEDVENIMEPRDRGQVTSIWHQILARETGQELEIAGSVGAEDGREPRSDLNESLVIPAWLRAVQWRSNENLEENVKSVRRLHCLLLR